jgi:hypothetical protein
MNTLRSVYRDLVDRRLWPVAAILVVALIAVPFLLAGGGDDAVEPRAAKAPSSVARDAQAAVNVVTPGAPAARRHSGRARNPFVPKHVPKVAAPSDGTTGPGPGTAATQTLTQSLSSGGSVGGLPGSSGPSTLAPAPTKPKARTPLDTYRVAVTISRDTWRRTWHDLARLTPLPSTRHPFLIFLGVLSDARTAVFLVSSDVTATGEGKCRPRRSSCETLELKAGDYERLDVLDDAGQMQHYILRVRRVERKRAGTAARAARSHARVSSVGRRLVRRQVVAIGSQLRITYSRRLGTLAVSFPTGSAPAPVAPAPGIGTAGPWPTGAPEYVPDPPVVAPALPR